MSKSSIVYNWYYYHQMCIPDYYSWNLNHFHHLLPLYGTSIYIGFANQTFSFFIAAQKRGCSLLYLYLLNMSTFENKSTLNSILWESGLEKRSSVPLVRWLNGTVNWIKKPPCRSRCDTIKIPPCSKIISAERRLNRCRLSPIMVMFPYKSNIFKWDVKQCTTNEQTNQHFFCELRRTTL